MSDRRIVDIVINGDALRKCLTSPMYCTNFGKDSVILQMFYDECTMELRVRLEHSGAYLTPHGHHICRERVIFKDGDEFRKFLKSSGS